MMIIFVQLIFPLKGLKSDFFIIIIKMYICAFPLKALQSYILLLFVKTRKGHETSLMTCSRKLNEQIQCFANTIKTHVA